MNTILVTGATGYIGSHVCKYLKNAGYRVVGVDRVRREHTLKHMDRFVHSDYDSHECFNLFVEEELFGIIHCAGTSLVGPSMTDPAEYYVNNVAKTADFLHILRQNPYPIPIVFSSSAAVYGNPDKKVIHENQAFDPMSPYGQSKAMIEVMLNDFHRAYAIPTMSLRYFNACGADTEGELGQAPGATHIIARLLESVRDNQAFTLYGKDYNTPDGTCIRDYVHVEDLAEAHMLAIQYLNSFGGSYSVNLGSGKGYSNQEIIDAVEQHVGKVNVVQGERRNGDPDRLIAGTVLASTRLGWHPKHSDLETIVNSAWKWYNNPPKSIDI